MTKITVDRAAIIGRDGKIWSVPRPERHHHVIKLMVLFGYPTPVAGIQGFLLSNGKFVGRKEAAKIAIEAKQIKKLNWPPNLFSEDLW